MSVREAMLETYLLKQVKEQGGVTAKMTIQGRRGWPDRLVILPGSMTLVELKRPKRGHLSYVQSMLHAKLRCLGVEVQLLSSTDQIDALLNRLAKHRRLWPTGNGDDDE